VKRRFNKSRLITPRNYYTPFFPQFDIKKKWIKVLCPFHDDEAPSLSINTEKGCFKCWGCGEKGGDIISFHMKKHGMSFVDAVSHFNAWEYYEEN